MAILSLISIYPINSSLASSEASYNGYVYDKNNEAVPAPIGYLPYKYVKINQIIKKATWNPTDMFKDQDGNLNIIDSVDGNLEVFSPDLDFVTTVKFYQNGNEVPLMNAGGMFITGKGSSKKYYVTDPSNYRVVVADSKGNIIKELTRPKSDMLSKDMEFAPSKVLVDPSGNIYVLVPGIYYGACVFDQDGNFLTFFGSNKVGVSAGMLLDYLWKQILNKTQRAYMKQYIPVEYENFTIDKNGFIYTVTSKSDSGTVSYSDQIKKYNADSINILKDADYGDLQTNWINGVERGTTYCDLSVMDNGNIAALDNDMCKITMFDSQGNRLMTFGTEGTTEGSFNLPIAIETIGDNVYVLDQKDESITEFRPTSFGRLILDTTYLYNQGKYKDSINGWKEVIKRDGSYQTAYVGIGEALLNENQYQQAMNYFKLGWDKKGYSDAFEQYRKVILKKMFGVIFALLCALVLLFLILGKFFGRKKLYEADPLKKNLFGKFTYALFHPGEGSLVLTRRTPTDKIVVVSIGIVIVWFIAAAINWQFTGFAFNSNYIEDFSAFPILINTIVIFILWIISNWCVCSLMDSSARISDLICVTAVALVPYILSIFISTALSNFLTLDESTLLSILQIIFIVWSVLLLLVGMMTVHEFTMFRAVLSMALAIIGMIIIVFLSVLMWSMLQQALAFFASIWNEATQMAR